MEDDFISTLNADEKLLFLKSLLAMIKADGRIDDKSQRIVEELFEAFMNDSRLLPMPIRSSLPASPSEELLAETICTYIANMTDMMAIEEHQKLMDVHTRF